MKTQRDKRIAERRDCRISMIYADENKDCFHCARVRNFSEGGLCFETDFAPVPGNKIYTIREDEKQNYEYFRPDCSGNISDKDSMAEVRWRVPVSTKDGSSYRVGVRYRRPQ